MAHGVEFHTGVPDTLDFTCRLLRKAYRRGATVLCLAPGERLEALDRALWTFVEREFLPHALLGRAKGGMLARTPIWLSSAWPDVDAVEAPRRDVIVNLGGPLPVEAAASARVIEVVGADPDEVDRGRSLWRQYKVGGFEITHHPFKPTRDD